MLPPTRTAVESGTAIGCSSPDFSLIQAQSDSQSLSEPFLFALPHRIEFWPRIGSGACGCTRPPGRQSSALRRQKRCFELVLDQNLRNTSGRSKISSAPTPSKMANGSLSVCPGKCPRRIPLLNSHDVQSPRVTQKQKVYQSSAKRNRLMEKGSLVLLPTPWCSKLSTDNLPMSTSEQGPRPCHN